MHEQSLTPGAVTDQNRQWKGDGTVVGTIVFKTCECGTLHGKRDLADVIEWRISRREIILKYLGQPNVNNKGPYKRVAEGSLWWKQVGTPLEARKSKETDSPLEPAEGT